MACFPGEVEDSSGGAVYRDASHYAVARIDPSIKVVALEADIYFPNVDDLQESLADLQEKELVRCTPSYACTAVMRGTQHTTTAVVRVLGCRSLPNMCSWADVSLPASCKLPNMAL